MTPRTIGIALLVALALIVAAASRIGSDSTPTATASSTATVSSAPAAPADWRTELADWPDPDAMSNCAALQHEFDLSMGIAEARQRHGMLGGPHLERASVADDRMREIGCYG